MTTCAFLAALWAALYATEAYAIEVEKRLGQQRCIQHDDLLELEISRGLASGYGCGTASGSGFPLSVPSLTTTVRKPDAFIFVLDDLTVQPLQPLDISGFVKEEHAISNLGRSALVQVRIHIRFEVAEQAMEYWANIGNIGPGNESYVFIYIAESLKERLRIIWCEAKENDKIVPFFPSDQLPEGFEYRPTSEQPALFPPEEPESPA